MNNNFLYLIYVIEKKRGERQLLGPSFYNSPILGPHFTTCKPKSQRGMGFRNLQAFNLALLAKQAWRILSNPSTLVGCILKAKYFPFSDILHAELGSIPSFTWRSIFNSLEVLRCGTRWRVGNGRLIHIWEDKWLPTPSTYKVISPPQPLVEYPMVSSLIDPVSNWWNVELV